MQQPFQSILIPVDFTVNTRVAVSKALELCKTGAPHFYLFHVCRLGLPGLCLKAGAKTRQEAEAEMGLKEWAHFIYRHMPTAFVHCKVVCAVFVQAAIVQMAQRVKANLVVIGKQSGRRWLPWQHTVRVSVLAKKTGRAVLTVKPGCLHQPIKNVVVPVNLHLPLHKMDAIRYLCRCNKIRVFLVGFTNNDGLPQHVAATAVPHVHQWLRSVLRCPAEYAILPGRNKARAIIGFAETHKADVLLLHAGAETKPGGAGTSIADLLPCNSRLQVLTLGAGQQMNP